jgi:hypothetical protein
LKIKENKKMATINEVKEYLKKMGQATLNKSKT